MSRNEPCPEKFCIKKVDITVHEGTGQKIYWEVNSSGITLHKHRYQRYWCVACDAAIPWNCPCIHKRIATGEVPPPKKDGQQYLPI